MPIELRFDSSAWTALPPPARVRLARIAGRRMTDAGLIVIDAQRFRSLEQNRADALERLVEMIRAVARRAQGRAGRRGRRVPRRNGGWRARHATRAPRNCAAAARAED